jgi:predicted SAM-dependent methyltransferase
LHDETRSPSVMRSMAAGTINFARRGLTPSLIKRHDRLHLGAGSRYLEGWGNVDLRGLKNLTWDLTVPLPLQPGSVKYIYTEHFIEHIPPDACRKLFVNARTALAKDGVMRISTPDLRWWADAYLQGHIEQHPWSHWFPDTPCVMLNDQLHKWGHLFVYDEPQLTALLRDCGFTQIDRRKRGESEHEALRDLESRPASGDLILEARWA